MSDGLFRPLSRRGSWDDESRSWSCGRRQDSVLLFVPWIELVASDQGKHAPRVLVGSLAPAADAMNLLRVSVE